MNFRMGWCFLNPSSYCGRQINFGMSTGVGVYTKVFLEWDGMGSWGIILKVVIFHLNKDMKCGTDVQDQTVGFDSVIHGVHIQALAF